MRFDIRHRRSLLGRRDGYLSRLRQSVPMLRRNGRSREDRAALAGARRIALHHAAGHLVPGGAESPGALRIRAAHEGAPLGVAELAVAGEVVDVGAGVYPDHRVTAATR